MGWRVPRLASWLAPRLGSLGRRSGRGLAAKLRDGGFPDEELRQIGRNVRPGSAALVVVTKPVWLDKVERVLRLHGGEVARKEVPAV